MNRLILGMIIGLLGVGLLKTDYDVLGIIMAFSGIYLGMKGRDEVDKILPPKPWEKGPD